MNWSSIMGTPAAPAPTVDSTREAPVAEHRWGPLSSGLLRFAFTYWLLYSLPLIVAFPGQVASLAVENLAPRSWSAEPQSWANRGLEWMNVPGKWLDTANKWLTPRVAATLLHVTTESPTDPSGSGDRLFAYCTAFTDLVLAAAVGALWTAASLLWQWSRGLGRPNYDRLHAWMRLIVRFH